MRRRTILAWCSYDFANSAFTTLVVTFVYSAYFTARIAPDRIAGTALWSRGVTASALAVAVLSPLLGAVADRGGRRKLLLLACTGISVAATAALFLPGPGQTGAALLCFFVANVTFELAGVLYNAFLPDVATPERIGRISGYGWALGYVGGLAAMVVALLFVVRTGDDQSVRATNLLVAAWFAVFSVPLFLFVREDRSRARRGGPVLLPALRRVAATFREVRRHRQVVRFLAARLVFNDGLVTIFFFGGIYAKGTFHFSTEKLLGFGILLNVTAAAGAFAMGHFDDRFGGKRTILLSLVALGLSSLAAVLARREAVFWVAGSLIGVFSGPNQAASRSLLGRFVPPEKESEFFGFFAFSGKATAFLGPFLLGVLTELFGSQRAGISVVLLFFLAGGLLLAGVDEREGIERAGRGPAAAGETGG